MIKGKIDSKCGHHQLPVFLNKIWSFLVLLIITTARLVTDDPHTFEAKSNLYFIWADAEL